MDVVWGRTDFIEAVTGKRDGWTDVIEGCGREKDFLRCILGEEEIY